MGSNHPLSTLYLHLCGLLAALAHVCYCTASPTPEHKLPSTPFPAQTCPTKVGVYHNYNCGLWGFRAYHKSGPMLGLLDHHICLVHQFEPLECLTWKRIIEQHCTVWGVCVFYFGIILLALPIGNSDAQSCFRDGGARAKHRWSSTFPNFNVSSVWVHSFHTGFGKHFNII